MDIINFNGELHIVKGNYTITQAAQQLIETITFLEENAPAIGWEGVHDYLQDAHEMAIAIKKAVTLQGANQAGGA